MGLMQSHIFNEIMWINGLDLCFYEFASGGQCTRKSTEIIQPLLCGTKPVCVSTCLGENGEVIGQWGMMHFSLILQYSACVCVCIGGIFHMLIYLFLQQFTFKLGNYWFNYNCLTYGASFLFPFISFILIWWVWVMMQKWVTDLCWVGRRPVHSNIIGRKCIEFMMLHFYFKAPCHCIVYLYTVVFYS